MLGNVKLIGMGCSGDRLRGGAATAARMMLIRAAALLGGSAVRNAVLCQVHFRHSRAVERKHRAWALRQNGG